VPTRAALVGTIAFALIACVSVTPEELGPAIDAPVYLRPDAAALVGVERGQLVVSARRTTLDAPMTTRLIQRVAGEARTAVASVYTKTSTPFRVRLFPLFPGFRVNLPGVALGSAFFIHPSGLALTNDHVIRSATEIRLLTSEGKELMVTVLARDPVYDLALLRAPAENAPYAALAMGSADEIGPGDHAIAIGNPLGLGHTVTLGIISATDRHLSGVPGEEARVVDFMQIDTPINPGSSGGPLVTLTGAWVGVNTAGIVQAQNIGFSIPSTQVLEFLDDVRAGKGRVEVP
jgi:S1-C subfamily serine protease